MSENPPAVSEIIIPALSATSISSDTPPQNSAPAVSTRDVPSTHVLSSSGEENEGVGGGGEGSMISGNKEKKRVQLEGFTKCSESLLWKLMMSFYDRKGVDSVQ